MAKVLKLLILLPVAVLILAFAIANRQTVSVSLDPFSAPDASSAFVAAPLCLLLFLVLMVGVVVGGIATWFSQGVNRRRARDARDEAEHWREEAQRLREQPQLVGPASRTTGRVLVRSGT